MADTEAMDVPAQTTSQAVLTKPKTYTEQEQLLLLIDAVERLVVGSIEIEGALVDFLVEETERLQSPITLSFESDNVLALTPEDEGLEARRPAIAELRGPFNFEVHHPLKSATRSDYWKKKLKRVKALPLSRSRGFRIEIFPGSVVAYLI
jgi:hypothetical protein